MVAPNQWCATADRAGNFILRDVPAGPYTIVAWHKAAGFFTKTITVDGSGNAAIEFFIPLPKIAAAADADRRQK